MSKPLRAGDTRPESHDRRPNQGGAIVTDRADLLDSADEVIDYATRKTTGGGRIRDTDRERRRVELLRAKTAAIELKRKILSDQQLDALGERIEAIETRGRYR